MNPTQKGSAALFGVTFTMKPDARTAARLRSQNVWFAENPPRTRAKKSSRSASGTTCCAVRRTAR